MLHSFPDLVCWAIDESIHLQEGAVHYSSARGCSAQCKFCTVHLGSLANSSTSVCKRKGVSRWWIWLVKCTPQPVWQVRSLKGLAQLVLAWCQKLLGGSVFQNRIFGVEEWWFLYHMPCSLINVIASTFEVVWPKGVVHTHPQYHPEHASYDVVLVQLLT